MLFTGHEIRMKENRTKFMKWLEAKAMRTGEAGK
jgi:hypothetical protein